VRCVAASADGKHLISGSNDQTVGVWDVDGGKQVAMLREHTHVVEAPLSPPSRWSPAVWCLEELSPASDW
jgi:WD40 repeat protein